jgi:hypothetical protein
VTEQTGDDGPAKGRRACPEPEKRIPGLRRTPYSGVSGKWFRRPQAGEASMGGAAACLRRASGIPSHLSQSFETTSFSMPSPF